MNFDFSRRTVNGVTINRIIDPKFKTGAVYIRFLTSFDIDTAPALSLIPALLCSANKKLDSQDKLSKRLNELYGASLSGVCLQCSDMLELLFAVDFIADKYAFDGEYVSLECAQLLLDCIFNPLADNLRFDESEFNIRKNDLLDAIDSEINDKASYALSESFGVVYKGELRACRHYGSREAVQALTPEGVFDVYKRLLSEAKVHITVCAGEELAEVEKLFEDAFSYERTQAPLPDYYSYSPIKDECEYAQLLADVKQANLVVAFKTEYRDYYVNRVLSALYGESPISKLFMNVREKLSLCYYCQSVYSATKATMLVVSGVDAKNIQKSQNEIAAQLQSMARGEFTNEELESAKLYLVSLLRSKYDRKSAVSEWYFSEELTGDNLTIEQAVDKINAVSADDIIRAAGSLKLDTVFVLKGGEVSDDE